MPWRRGRSHGSWVNKSEGLALLCNEVSAGPFSERLNIIYGPNGIGKSKFFETLRLAVFDRHTVADERIAAIRPWGRDLLPYVCIDFLRERIEYRIEKQFVLKPSATLFRRENSKFE